MTEKWAYFFQHAEDTSEKDLIKLIGHDQIIERAYEELDRFTWNEQELLTYEQAEKYAKCYEASMLQKFDEGEKRGIEKGEKIGIEKGEKIAMLKVAKNMLKQGIDIQYIKNATGLSTEEINEILVTPFNS